jgi:hypothetical protein
MAAVRRLAVLVLLLLTLGLAACGGGHSTSAEPPTTTADSTAPGPTPTTAEKSARFTLLIDAIVGGGTVRSSETGTIAFHRSLAHLYKLLPGGGTPQELIVDGPFTYSNANVGAALKDRSVKPWTKLDTRRLTARQRSSHPDELAHVRTLFRLPEGVRSARRVESMVVAGERVTQFTGEVDPARIVARTPAGERRSIAVALRNDYPAKPFLASYWLDDARRVRRVLVSYATTGGTQITLDGRFSEFGTTIDTTLPPAGSIQDITP